MFRPLRIEFPGASYHVTSRSDQREPIFENDSDRTALLGVLEEGMHHSDEQVLDYCLMGNHYHVVLHTRRTNLSRMMRHFNGVVTQAFNRRHRKMGHLFHVPGPFQGSSGGPGCLSAGGGRYVEFNPVARPRMMSAPGEWPWSSTARPWARLKPPESPGKWLSASGLFSCPPTMTLGPCVHGPCSVNGFAWNTTLSADDKIIERAHKAAQAMGKILNQAVRDKLEQFAADEEGLDAELDALCSMAGRGNSGGQRISRDELYADRLEYKRGA